jgi:hypothetical protein
VRPEGPMNFQTSDYDSYADELANYTAVREFIERARQRDPDGAIDYRVGDSSKAMPGEASTFDAVASFLALNDVVGLACRPKMWMRRSREGG